MSKSDEAKNAVVNALKALSTERKPREVIQFETSWGLVKCHDDSHVWFPRFFGEGIASKINRRTTFVTLTFDAPVDLNLQSELTKANERIKELEEQTIKEEIHLKVAAQLQGKIQELEESLTAALARVTSTMNHWHEAKEEIEILRRFGNKDCTAMADEELALLAEKRKQNG